jgi:excisionase family DNA binding protein
MGEEFLTVRDAAERLGLHRATVARHINSGKILAYVGVDRRRKLVRREDIDRLMVPTPITNTGEKEGSRGIAP